VTAFGRSLRALLVLARADGAHFRLARMVFGVHLNRAMNSSTNDQIEGTLHKIKGKIKEVAGKVANKPDLAAEGQTENLAGTIQEKVGQIEKVFEK